MIKFGVIAIVGLSLAGCASSASEPSAAPSTQAPTASTPSATPSPTLTPTPTPTEVEAAVTGVVITASDIELVGADGAAIEEFPYDEDAETVKAALTEAFGAEPESGDEVVNAGTTDYYWDDFSLRIFDAEGGSNGDTFWVVAEGGSVGDIAISAEGVAVGDLESDVKSVAFDNYTDDGGTETIEFYWMNKTEVDADVSTDSGDPAIDFVRAWVPKPGEKISRIDAPVSNYGE